MEPMLSAPAESIPKGETWEYRERGNKDEI